MRKVRLALVLVSVLIVVVPIAFVVLQHQDDLLGLIIPPEARQILNGESNSTGDIASVFMSSDFKVPELVGEPQFDPSTKTASFTFDFTNPLKTDLSVNKLEGGIVTTDGVFLGNLTIKDPISLSSGESMNITALGTLSDEGLAYLKSVDLDSINVDLVDLNVDIAGVTVKVDRQNIGDIPIPPEFYEALESLR